MSDPPIIFDQINLIVNDMDATIAFYSRLGLRVPEAPIWPPGSGARHTAVTMPNGARLEFDNLEMVRLWHPGWTQQRGSTRAVLGFSLPTREAVDTRYAELTSVGYFGAQPPHDAFWGARYAVVLDPDTNHVGLMSPKDPQRQFTPGG
jgi:catechol 2,3-dioxygenase-like lactoylglutathione lyase family enzyme